MADDAEVAELRRLTLRLLDADADGKLSFEDAKAMAIASSASASAAAKARLLAWLDADGDGAVSWAETEAGARAAFHRIEEKVTHCVRVLTPYRTSLLLGGGFVSCFYGKNFKYTILFAKTFATTGWPSLGPALEEFQRSYERGKKAYQASPELRDASLQDVVGAARNPTPSTAASLLAALEGVLVAVEPAKLWNVCKAAYVGASAAFAGVLSDSAARVGVGVSLGDAIADVVNAVAAPLVASLLSKLRDRALRDPSVQDAIGDSSLVDDATIRAWCDTGIAAASTALGVYVAHKVDDLVYLFSACLAGATLAVDKAMELLLERNTSRATRNGTKSSHRHPLKSKAKQAAIWALAGAGFAYQRVFGYGDIPWLLRVPLVPLTLAEAALASMALSLRATKAI